MKTINISIPVKNTNIEISMRTQRCTGSDYVYGLYEHTSDSVASAICKMYIEYWNEVIKENHERDYPGLKDVPQS